MTTQIQFPGVADGPVPDRFPRSVPESGSQRFPTSSQAVPNGSRESGTEKGVREPIWEPVPEFGSRQFPTSSHSGSHGSRPVPSSPTVVPVPPLYRKGGDREPTDRAGTLALIQKALALGVELRADADVVRVRPVGLVPPDLLADLKAHKADLLALLGGETDALVDEVPMECTECGSDDWTMSLVQMDGARTCADCACGLTQMRKRGVAI